MITPSTGSSFVPKDTGPENGLPFRCPQTGNCRDLGIIITDMIRIHCAEKNPDCTGTVSGFPVHGKAGK